VLRALVALLLLANLVFFALSRGWFEPMFGLSTQHEREPQRLAAQLNPQSVQLVDTASAGAALSTPQCLQAGPFTEAEIAVAEEALKQAQVDAQAWARVRIDRPAAWWIYLGKFPDRAAMARRQDELRRQGYTADVVGNPPQLQPGLSLGRFDGREAADAALTQIQERGLRNAKLMAAPAPEDVHWLRAAQADAALRARLAALPAAALGSGFAPCAKSP
jgi:hypothetical protein